MARRVIGSIYKGENGKPDLIKISQDIALTKGQYVNLENEKLELEGLDRALAAGVLDADYVDEAKVKTVERWNKVTKTGKAVKDMVRFNLVVNTKK